VERVRAWIQVVIRAGAWKFGDPESVAQDVLVQLVRVVQAGRVNDPGSFEKYVYSVAKNVCVDVYHRERRRREVAEGDSESARESARDEAQAPDDDLERRERDGMLRYVLQRLPPACRDLLGWIHGEGANPAEAARRLGIEAGTVRVRVHRCLKKAREIYLDRATAAVSRRRGT
jgi:RNA polymerase sigma-70 factor (ECF subfamily)